LTANKIDLRDVSFLLPVRIDSLSRLHNIKCILGWLNRFFDTYIFVLEASRIQQCMFIEGSKSIDYTFISDLNPLFHRTYYQNLLTIKASTPILAIWDVDVVVNPIQLLHAIDKIRKGKAQVVIPYDGRCYNVKYESQNALLKNIDVSSHLENYISKAVPLNHNFTVGGAVLYDRVSYLNIGMDNEHIRAWGPEDCERIKRAEKFGFYLHRQQGPLFHFWHARGMNSGYASKKLAVRSKQEYLRICQMSIKELSDYIKSWPWVNKYCNIMPYR